MYIVLEIQTNGEGTVSTLVNQYDTECQADSKFHQILAAASVGEVPIHTAFILTNDGRPVRTECYKHGEEESHEILPL